MSIDVTELVPIGRGVERPEQVLVTSDGRVFASDKGSAVAEILGENDIRRIGNAGGDPNGIALDHRGRFARRETRLGCAAGSGPDKW